MSLMNQFSPHKNNTLYVLALFLIHTLAVSFYFLINLEAYLKDIVLVISLTIIMMNLKQIPTVYDPKDRFIYLFPIYALLSGLFMAMFNYSQPFLYTALATRILLIIMLMYVALIFILNRITLKRLYLMAYAFTLFIFLFDFYLYFSNNLSMLYIDTTYAFRMDTLRLTIAYQTVVALIFFFFYDSKKRFLSFIPFFLLLLVLVFVDKTRATMIGIFGVLLISMLNLKSKWNIIAILTLITALLISLVVSDFESSIFQPLVNMYTQTQSEVTEGAGNINVRSLELVYFWNRLDPMSMIFGYGMDNHAFKLIYPSNFYLSDLGIFKVFYLHGVIGLLLFLGIYYRMYREASKDNTPLHKTGKALVLFQLFAPTLNFTYYLEGMLLFFTIYILIKKDNSRKTAHA